MQKNVLITNFEIVQFSGSEISAMTIAKRFKELNYKVYIATLNYSSPLYDVAKENFDFAIDLINDDFDFTNITFDIVWSQHSFILDWLIFNYDIKAKRIICSSLSPHEIFECAPIYGKDLNLVLANSEETKTKLIEEEVNNVMLFENYAFEDYFKNNRKIEELKNIVIVSNHIPEELMDTLNLLRQDFNVDIYGFAGKRELITDKILKKYDLVITIGKTVQFSMALGIPVYIYDKFGGPGYLKLNNIENNRKFNFSGRGYDKKTKEELYEDIKLGHKECLNDVNGLKEYAYENFNFEKNFNKVLDFVNSTDELDLVKIKKEYEKYRRNILISRKLMLYILEKEYYEKLNIQKNFNSIILGKDNIINELRAEIDNLKNSNIEISNKLSNITNSRSWKYTKIFRKEDI